MNFKVLVFFVCSLFLLHISAEPTLYGKVWDHAYYFNLKFSNESFVAIKGKVVKYRDRLEINVLNINTASLDLYSQYGFQKSSN